MAFLHSITPVQVEGDAKNHVQRIESDINGVRAQHTALDLALRHI
jgi:hypothetical protein